MVIPWIGFPLSKLLEKVEPMSQARYVSFQTLHDPKRLPNQRTTVLGWPYVEGLRLDEAMHPLAISRPDCTVRFCRRRTAPDSARGSVEVWVQKHQVDREDQFGRRTTANYVE